MPSFNDFIDERTGRVRVIREGEKEPVDLWPVDAKEQIRKGTAEFASARGSDVARQAVREADEKVAANADILVTLQGMNVADLKTYASSQGVELNSRMRKADILAAIEAKLVETGQIG